MKRFWAWWVSLFGIREPGEPLALVRILAGISLAVSVLTVLPAGTWRILWLDAARGGYRELGPLAGLETLPSGLVIGLMVASLVAALGLTLGALSRSSALLGLISFNALIHLNPHDGSAYDSLLTNLLWILVLSRAGGTWSLDARFKYRRWRSRELIPAWPRYLLVLQLILVYGTTGLQKVSIHWVPGGDLSALYYILQDPFWQRFDMSWTAHAYPLTQLGTLVTWLWEVGAFLLLPIFWFRHTRQRDGRLRRWSNRFDLRSVYAITGIAFHLGILLLMRVGPFSLISLAYYPAFWSGQEWCRRLGNQPAPDSIDE